MGGNFLEATFVDEKGLVTAPIFGWTQRKRFIKIWGFDTGSIYEGAWTFKGNVWTSQFSSVRPSGERVKENVTLAFDKNAFTATGTRADTKASSLRGSFHRINDESTPAAKARDESPPCRALLKEYAELDGGRVGVP